MPIKRNFRQVLTLATQDAQHWLILRLRRDSPVRTGRYRAGWAPYKQGIRNPVPYAIYVARREHFTSAVQEYPHFLARRIRERMRAVQFHDQQDVDDFFGRR